MGKQGSPRSPRPEAGNESPLGRRMSGVDYYWSSKPEKFYGYKNDFGKYGKGHFVGKRHIWIRKHLKPIALMFVFMAFLFLLDSVMISISDSMNAQRISTDQRKSSGLKEENRVAYEGKNASPIHMYDRLLNMASSVLIENEFKQEPSNLWEEPYQQAAAWKPCADKNVSTSLGRPKKNNGYILVSANGGLNQQRVAICNAVAVASLLNATLVIPRFLYSSVWKDPSQFGDIYQENHFIDIMKDGVDIVKELPPDLKSVDIEAIGSLITDEGLVKEAKPADYLKIVLPLLLRNRVVHLLGFGNRLGFDPLPLELQKLRCKCNFHALKFSPKIQKVGSLLVRRIRKYDAARSLLDKQLLGNFLPFGNTKIREDSSTVSGHSKYLALHLRFEVDMVAYSFCDFGGGERERRELQAYRKIHFPLLMERLKNSKPISPVELRKLGRCPLTPEEAALVLAGIGFKRGTYIYLAGSQIYGGEPKMNPFTSLYPNLVTKETLLTPSELAPFQNFSSQLAALDFIACATSDVFAMTDSGSQLSSLVSGFRTYYGNGDAPTLRPNKKRIAAILSENYTIEWKSFEERVKKMIEEGQRVRVRGLGRSIYRQPRCPECMCKTN
ncbi:O-fucosyltransferase 8 isoform X2 [Cannabis sativa]|uniref:O-fucosyltransferase 8 isoform X2 n=1 Tax=Cannabis sativa TaxID=3483 RepID=UPI0029CA8ED9|nr:O-fucosyltransferase 8 isoform X2 [Cannabis sativa]